MRPPAGANAAKRNIRIDGQPGFLCCLGRSPLTVQGYIPKTRHKLAFQIPLPQSTVGNHLHTDKNALRERIVALRAEGMSYRKIVRVVGLHWTRIGQILNSED